ncbi:fasciculation and elongation protein zeta-2 isoform X3 [Nelusetta ayraudi]|uniref:fasciculation and elongation protein zeta-2 isoform X3 n=1 Tax=Nelusetta ayraudi TaxID=303726 RepID=UPI003F6F1680
MAAAPALHLDDDWPAEGAADSVSERKLLSPRGRAEEASAARLRPEDGGSVAGHEGSFPPGGTGALAPEEDQELVAGFDRRLAACFRSVDHQTDGGAPVGPIGEDSLLEEDPIWKALTSSYGRVMAVDWRKSRTCSLQIPALSLTKLREEDVRAELPDDEELREQLDMHSIISSCLVEEPLFTAEQVIEEIEEMMQDSDVEAEPNPSQSDLSVTSVDVQRTASSPDLMRMVRHLSVAELMERLEETEASVRRLSEELVQQLARRDELDFEKEVKNCFISALIDVQSRQKEQRELQRRKKKQQQQQQLRAGGGGGAGAGGGEGGRSQDQERKMSGSYLTTVIPYEKNGRPPSLEDLQVLTKILEAMRDDSDKVPSLLTDYILKVLCPT